MDMKKAPVRAVITVVGFDTIGIIARVTTLLAENKINILDISQTIMEDLFTMSMVVDISSATEAFATIRDSLEELGKEIGLEIHTQHEDVFKYMHRI